MLAGLLCGATATGLQPAKADWFCYSWEKNCIQDGRIGSSPNDLLGLPGGDSIEKGVPIIGAGIGALFGGPAGAMGTAAASGIVTNIYQNLDHDTQMMMKNPWEMFD